MYIKNNNQRLYTFFTLVLFLRDFMEENNLPAIDFKFEVLHHTKGLSKALTKVIDRMIDRTNLGEDVMAIDQYITASQIMDHLFDVGMKIENMENQIQKETLITQLNILLHSYNLPQLELLAIDAEQRVEQTGSSHE